MSLLELDGVSKRYCDSAGVRTVLRNVSFELGTGELAAVWGLRGSGRTTLLRLAAGIESVDSGTVRFEGRSLQDGGDDLLGGGIGFPERTFRCAEGQAALDQVVVGLLARGVAPREARCRAYIALERVAAEQTAGQRLASLGVGERVRISIARSLALEPALLLIDEPTTGVDLLERDGILVLLRSLADQGTAILATTGDSTGLWGADLPLVIGEGQLRGAPRAELGTVLPLRRPAERRAAG